MQINNKVWFVYMISCSDGSLYTGITTNLMLRISKHNSVKGGAKYTRSRQPVSLVFYEEYPSRSLAGKRECTIKKLSAIKKRALIGSSHQKA
jgi:putative endonuclease